MTLSAISVETRSSKVPKYLLNMSEVKKGHFGGLIFLIFAIGIEKFNVKVSFRLEFSYIDLGGGGRLTASLNLPEAGCRVKLTE